MQENHIFNGYHADQAVDRLEELGLVTVDYMDHVKASGKLIGLFHLLRGDHRG